MQKNMIDEWYSNTLNYKRLVEYTHKAIKKLKVNINPQELVASSYIYLVSYTKEDIVSIEGKAKGFIKGELNMSNSSTMRLYRKGYVEFDNNEPSTSIDTFNIDEMINSFITTLSLYDKGVFNIYYTMRMNTCRKIAKYKKLSLVGASIVLKEGKILEERLRCYIKNNYLNDED